MASLNDPPEELGGSMAVSMLDEFHITYTVSITSWPSSHLADSLQERSCGIGIDPSWRLWRHLSLCLPLCICSWSA